MICAAMHASPQATVGPRAGKQPIGCHVVSKDGTPSGL